MQQNSLGYFYLATNGTNQGGISNCLEFFLTQRKGER
jgi:hypothetical protein